MKRKKLTNKDNFELWLSEYGNLLGCVLTLLLFVCFYYYSTQSYRQINFEEYTEHVELVSLESKKEYALPEFYSTKQKLDKIVFEVVYFHQGVKYQPTVNIYREYTTPEFEKIIDNNELDKLSVKCKRDSPNEAIVIIDDK